MVHYTAVDNPNNPDSEYVVIAAQTTELGNHLLN